MDLQATVELVKARLGKQVGTTDSTYLIEVDGHKIDCNHDEKAFRIALGGINSSIICNAIHEYSDLNLMLLLDKERKKWLDFMTIGYEALK